MIGCPLDSGGLNSTGLWFIEHTLGHPGLCPRFSSEGVRASSVPQVLTLEHGLTALLWTPGPRGTDWAAAQALMCPLQRGTASPR